MELCTRCNRENPSIANYCMHCGFTISKSAKEEVQNYPKEKRTKRVRELEEILKSLERKNAEIVEQNNQVNKEISFASKERDHLKMQLNKIKNQVATKRPSAENNKALSDLLVPTIILFLIALFVLKHF